MKLIAAVLALVLVSAQPRTEQLTVFLIGDSTMADKPAPESNPERGWGQMLPMFPDDQVKVRNFAVNGRSTKSFIDEGRWDEVLSQVRPGDHVLIQFGHNDQKIQDPSRYANPYTAYRRNLERFVVEARSRGGVPVLFSSIVRRRFNAHGVLEDSHGPYPYVARQVALDLGAPFVDLQLLTEDLVLQAGEEGSKALFLWVPPGASPMYPHGTRDDTHLSVAGATAVARLAAQGLQRAGGPLAGYLRNLP